MKKFQGRSIVLSMIGCGLMLSLARGWAQSSPQSNGQTPSGPEDAVAKWPLFPHCRHSSYLRGQALPDELPWRADRSEAQGRLCERKTGGVAPIEIRQIESVVDKLQEPVTAVRFTKHLHRPRTAVAMNVSWRPLFQLLFGRQEA